VDNMTKFKTNHDYKIGGLRQKYHITKTSGEPVDESAVYFVLRVDEDPHARNALLAYADSVAGENEMLASDLILLVERFGGNMTKTKTGTEHKISSVSEMAATLKHADPDSIVTNENGKRVSAYLDALNGTIVIVEDDV